jgi:hypothetical protein
MLHYEMKLVSKLALLQYFIHNGIHGVIDDWKKQYWLNNKRYFKFQL